MEHRELFDRILASLGFRYASELARELGRSNTAAWNWRHHGLPKRLHSELMSLAFRRGRQLPPEFYAEIGIPPP